MVTIRSSFMLWLFIVSVISMETSAQSSSVHQNMFVFRLKPHEDLKKSIQQFALTNHIKAGAIVTCVGSLEQYHVRFANQQNGSKTTGHFEILSLTGTFSDSSMHVHLSLADSAGKTIGGHLLDENLVYTTAEIVLVELTELEFQRAVDSTYGYSELVIRKKEKKNKKQ